MRHSFSHVSIDAIVGIASKDRKNINEIGISYGIEERRLKRFLRTNGFKNLSIIQKKYSLGDLVTKCCTELFEKTRTDPREIDAFIVSSQTHDYLIPGTSYTLQERLNLSHDCLMFDMIQGCPGYVNSLFQAASLIESGACKKVLVCTGEVSNHEPDLTLEHLESYLEAGDGCGATLLSYSDNCSPLDFSIKTFGDQYKVVFDSSYGTKTARVKDELSTNGFEILGSDMNVFVLDKVKEHIEEFLSDKKMSFDDIGVCLSQQTSLTLINALNSVLDSPDDWIPFLASNLGNLSSASIPVFISDNENLVVKSKGKPVLLAGFGVGLASSLCIGDLKNTKILPLMQFG